MSRYTDIKAVVFGDDGLLVTATKLLGQKKDSDGSMVVTSKPVKALGWVSATTNHYGPECYVTEDEAFSVPLLEAHEGLTDNEKTAHRQGRIGHLREGSVPRRMTEQEVQEYLIRLLDEANP